MGKCAKCGKEVSSEWALCPFCGESLKKTCPKCGKEIDPAWALCPFCGEKLKGGAKTEPKAEKFKFEFSEDTAGLAESFDKQIKESEQPPKGILGKEEVLDLYENADINADIGYLLPSLRYYAEKGDADCQYALGCIFNDELYNGYKPDNAESSRWFLAAANQGHAYAQCFIAGHYLCGDGVTKDLSKAFYWYKKAAEQGVADAMRSIGPMLIFGKGVAKNEAEGVKWLKKFRELDPEMFEDMIEYGVDDKELEPHELKRIKELFGIK